MPIGGAVTLAGFSTAYDVFEGLATGGLGGDHRWVVGVGAEYGAYVEFGTSRNRAYPYLFPAARTVMRRDFPKIAAAAKSKREPLNFITQETARAIEGEAKRNASGRPGPNVISGNLRSSIRAVRTQ